MAQYDDSSKCPQCGTGVTPEKEEHCWSCGFSLAGMKQEYSIPVTFELPNIQPIIPDVNHTPQPIELEIQMWDVVHGIFCIRNLTGRCFISKPQDPTTPYINANYLATLTFIKSTYPNATITEAANTTQYVNTHP